jgi:hypothetical protein
MKTAPSSIAFLSEGWTGKMLIVAPGFLFTGG